MSSPGTSSVVDLAASGDRSAQAALLVEQAPMARRTLYRLLGPGEEIDDLEQTVLCRLIESVGRFRKEADIGSFVRGICVHVARDHLRRKKVRRIVEPVADVESTGRAIAVLDDAETTLVRKESGDLVRRCLDDLPASQRIALVLRLIEGHSVSEVAELMDSARSTTRMRLYLGRKALLRALKRRLASPTVVGGSR